MMDAVGKYLDVAVYKDGEKFYFLIGPKEDGKMIGHEYLLYYRNMKNEKWEDFGLEIRNMATYKAGPNGGGIIDQSLYK